MVTPPTAAPTAATNLSDVTTPAPLPPSAPDSDAPIDLLLAPAAPPEDDELSAPPTAAPTTVASQSAPCPAGWLPAPPTEPPKCYRSVRSADCATACSPYGASLTCVSSATEDAFVYQSFPTDLSCCSAAASDYSCCVMIGLYQNDTSGGARAGWDAWRSGCDSGYRNWGGNQPNWDGGFIETSTIYSPGGGFGWDDFGGVGGECVCAGAAEEVRSLPLYSPPPPSPPPVDCLSAAAAECGRRCTVCAGATSGDARDADVRRAGFEPCDDGAVAAPSRWVAHSCARLRAGRAGCAHRARAAARTADAAATPAAVRSRAARRTARRWLTASAWRGGRLMRRRAARGTTRARAGGRARAAGRTRRCARRG